MKTQFTRPRLTNGIIPFLLMLTLGIGFAGSTMAAWIAPVPGTGNWSASAWPNTARTGQITTLTTSAAVTGNGTLFTTEITVGNIIKTTSDVVIGTVAFITDDTHLTLTGNAASNNTNKSYHFQGIGPGDDLNIVALATSTVFMDVDGTCKSIGTKNRLSDNASLTISSAGGSHTLTLSGTVTLNGGTAGIRIDNSDNITCTLNIDPDITVSCVSIAVGHGSGNISTYIFNISGTLQNSGTTSVISGTLTYNCNSGSTVEYNGAAQSVFQSTYFNLTLSGSGTKTMPSGNTTIIGNFSINSGVDVTLSTGSNDPVYALFLGGVGQLPGTWGGTGSGATFINTTYFNPSNGFLTVSTSNGYFRSQATGNWSDVSTWQSSPDNSTWSNATLAPTSAAVLITIQNPDNVTVDQSNLSGSAIVINGILTIAANKSLTATGTTTLNNPECLILESDATGTGSFIDNGTFAGTGTAKMERYLTTAAWHYISSPISNATANVFAGDFLRTSDPTTTNGWAPYITGVSTALQVMRGYACWKPGGNLETFSGDLNTGSETFTGNRTASDPYAGWHLVGDPYPSGIDLASGGITWDFFEPTAYFWNQGPPNNPPDYTNGNYDVYPTSGAWGTHTQYVPAEQGFFVHIVDTHSGNSTLTMTNTARVHNSVTFLKDATVIKNALLIVAVDFTNTYSDKISVHFNPNATAGYDPGYDAYKLWGMNEAPQLYSRIGGTNVTCNSLPFSQKNMVIPMEFSCGLPGTYTLIADSIETFENNIAISLEDLKLGTTQDLRLNPVYSFTYSVADNSNRFVLHFDNPSFGVNDQKNIQPVQIYSFENAVYIKSQDGNPREGNVFVNDLTGKELFHGTLSNQSLNRFTPSVVEGYYLVRVVTDTGSYNGKVYLR